MTTGTTGADARRKRARMPAAASDQASNEADAPVPPSRFVLHPADCKIIEGDDNCHTQLSRAS